MYFPSQEYDLRHAKTGLTTFVVVIPKESLAGLVLASLHYRPQSRGDNTFGSVHPSVVRLSVCPSVCGHSIWIHALSTRETVLRLRLLPLMCLIMPWNQSSMSQQQHGSPWLLILPSNCALVCLFIEWENMFLKWIFFNSILTFYCCQCLSCLSQNKISTWGSWQALHFCKTCLFQRNMSSAIKVECVF